ncbi:hypothetical protein K1719_010907 [Acacia pycnantha]|nr:hypothetical protein K1719_010907 [Acacia pycnantha]
MKFLLLLPFLQGPIWVCAAAKTPLLSPTVPPVSQASMAPFSPDIQVENEREPTDLDMKVVIALIVAGTALGIILSFLCFCICYKKCLSKFSRKNVQSLDVEKGLARTSSLKKISSFKVDGKKGSISIFDYKTIQKATSNFLETNILGEGGFGCVYKARLHHNLDVAVKKLNCESQDAQREFQNEVDMLSKIQHPNIISLLGCSSNGDTRFIVYELMQNGSLETQLHGPSHGSALTWHMRMKIALDTARGLEYLHEICKPPVIHRDLKSSNILLDANFNAKLCDFGFAIADGSQDKNDIKISGTLGYVAPEYILHGKLTDKSDVYAFGVVLLELVLGRKPVEKLTATQCQSIVTWAVPQLSDRSNLPNIVDPMIKNTMDLKHLYQVAAMAVLCVQPEPSYRPLITDVLHSLIPLVPSELGGTLRVPQASQLPSST